MGIGILQLIWPRHAAAAHDGAGAVPSYLTPLDFSPVGSSGSQAQLAHATATPGGGRGRKPARALPSGALSGPGTEFLPGRPSRPGSTPRCSRSASSWRERGRPAGRWRSSPAIGVPTALEIQKIADLFRPAKRRAFLIYDHVGIRDRWIAHLRWLDLHLPVKTFRASESAQWLATL